MEGTGIDRLGGDRPPITLKPHGPGQSWWRRIGPDVRHSLRTSRRDGWLARQAAGVVMNVTIGAIFLLAWTLLWWPAAQPPTVPPAALALKGFAVWALSFLPGWLYVRFLGQRARALWDEYVLNLHRLSWDAPRYLPEPPGTSQFHREWLDDGGDRHTSSHSIYQQKFDAYFGRSASQNARSEDFKVRIDTMFPVFLGTAVLAVCWTAVLWDDGFVYGPANAWEVLKFGFLGAYAFTIQMLLRRFFSCDLRPSAYTSALFRFAVVLISVTTLVQLLDVWLTGNPDIRRWEAVAAFTVGFFPLVATQALVRAASAPLRLVTPTLNSDYPLSQLDGLNIWFEARLAEENIDDMQNLTTANLIDVVLHTRVPVCRLIDWVDQAVLFLHLDRVEYGVVERHQARRGGDSGADGGGEGGQSDDGTPSCDRVAGSLGPGSRAGTRTRTMLRQLGIRTATDLLKAFPPDMLDPLEPSAAGRQRFRKLIPSGVDEDQIRLLVRVLDEEPALAPVWNWQDRGVQAHCPQRRPRSLRSCEPPE